MFSNVTSSVAVFLLDLPKKEQTLVINLTWVAIYWLIGYLVILGLRCCEPTNKQRHYDLVIWFNDVIGCLGLGCVLIVWFCGN